MLLPTILWDPVVIIGEGGQSVGTKPGTKLEMFASEQSAIPLLVAMLSPCFLSLSSPCLYIYCPHPFTSHFNCYFQPQFFFQYFGLMLHTCMLWPWFTLNFKTNFSKEDLQSNKEGYFPKLRFICLILYLYVNFFLSLILLHAVHRAQYLKYWAVNLNI